MSARSCSVSKTFLGPVETRTHKSLEHWISRWRTHSKTEMDKLKFEQCRSELDSKISKTSFRSEVITGSTHLRQLTDWSSEIDLATSIQDLAEAGSVFNCARMRSATLGFSNCRSRDDNEVRIQETSSGDRRGERTHSLSDVDWKQDRFHDLRLQNDVQGRATAMNDLLNTDLCNDNLKVFDQAWVETLMVMDTWLAWKVFIIDNWKSRLS